MNICQLKVISWGGNVVTPAIRKAHTHSSPCKIAFHTETSLIKTCLWEWLLKSGRAANGNDLYPFIYCTVLLIQEWVKYFCSHPDGIISQWPRAQEDRDTSCAVRELLNGCQLFTPTIHGPALDLPQDIKWHQEQWIPIDVQCALRSDRSHFKANSQALTQDMDMASFRWIVLTSNGRQLNSKLRAWQEKQTERGRIFRIWGQGHCVTRDAELQEMRRLTPRAPPVAPAGGLPTVSSGCAREA
jgi:hypothetical protein